MSPATIFNVQLILGYAAWLFCFRTYLWPRLQRLDPVDAHRAIAALHSFRFFGLVFILPGVVGPGLPSGFGPFAAYGDLATGVRALLALVSIGARPLFWFFVAAFNLVGTADLVIDYYHGIILGLPKVAGQLGAAYAIVMLYVPLLLITHVAAFYLLLKSGRRASAARITGDQRAFS